MRLRRETGDFTLAFPEDQLSITIAKNLKPMDFLGAIIVFETAVGDEGSCCVVDWAHYQIDDEVANPDLIILHNASVISQHSLAEYVPSTGVVTVIDD